ncbi:YlbF family regulator [Phosphitispora sp. TUW77]|uniref:YlbF family regulator n=1 Tax=Phosphitispora sp. TUW77 TaxID=3152361 RepID=UPI003AB5CB60
MSVEIIEKANELAELIAGSAELDFMRLKEEDMNQDPEAVKIITEFQKIQQDIYKKQINGQELTDEDKKIVVEMETKMKGNAAIKAYIEASESFENLLRSVNLIITKALSGNQSCDCDSADCGYSCDPGCSCN